MVLEKRHLVAKRVITKQIVGFVFIVAFLWFNEISGISRLIFGDRLHHFIGRNRWPKVYALHCLVFI